MLSISKITAIFSLLILATCTTSVDNLEVDSSFKYKAVKNGRIVVGGVVSLVNKLSQDQRLNYSNLMRKAILNERETYKVGFPGVVTNQIGDKPYKNIITSFRKVGMLTDAQIKHLKDKIVGFRYISFALIENNNVSKNHRENTNKKTNEITIQTTARREVTCSLHIYDLVLGKMVWSGSVDKSWYNSNNYKKEKESELVGVINAIGSLAGKGRNKSTKYHYPAPPTSEELLTMVFEGFAENFPEK